MSRRSVAVSAAGLIWLAAAGVIAVDELRPEPRPELPALELNQSSRIAVAPPVLAAGSVDARSTAGGMADRLDGLLAEGDLGGRAGIAVAPLGGDLIYEHNADQGFTPASTMKIITSVAVLAALGPDARFATTVQAGRDAGEIVLVGGGDPTLTTTDSSLEADGGTLADLAAATADALTADGISSVRLGFDDSLFSGPAIDPDWESGYVSSGVVAPVSALTVDGGRVRPAMRDRAVDPAAAAAAAFASRLADEGIAVEGAPSRTDGVAGGEPIAQVWSAPVADIVEYALITSDNDVSEVLARHVALASGEAGTSAAAAGATVEVMSGLGVDLTSQTVFDGSGLARGSAISPAVLVDALNAAADVDRPELRAVLSGLPVASFNGTLASRVADGAGSVRAKTGTLTGVTSLAGTAVGADGETYVFAIMADDVTDAVAARAAIDAVAAAIAE